MMNQRVSQSRRNEQGVVSIFIVIFAAIFMTIITASFINIMITDQQQATTMDLSQSAYDSAMGGVEDAKRALIVCQTTVVPNSGCDEIKNNPTKAAGDCTLLQTVGVSVFGPGENGNQEVPIQKNTAEKNDLDQAYTCVGISTQAPDYQATVGADKVSLIPIKSTSSVDSVTLSWNTAATTTQTNLPTLTSKFSPFDEWTSTNHYPPVIQASLITAGPSIDQADFDKTPGAGTTGAATLMLRPSTSSSGASFTSDARTAVGTVPANVMCEKGTNFSSAGPYSCSITISLGFALPPGQQAFLALQPIYQAADINIALKSGGSPASFTDVQAIVDSTGRANDIFRRVSARVNLVPTTGPYPNAALNLSGSLCKNMIVSQDVSGSYKSNNASCE